MTRNNSDASSGSAGGDESGEAPNPDLTRIFKRLRGPVGFVAVCAGILALVALLVAARVGRAILLPIVLAVVLNFLLSPVVRSLDRRGIPSPAAAAVVLLSVLGTVAFGAYHLAGPAMDWLDRAPRTLRVAEVKLRGLQESMKKLEQAAEEAREVTGSDGGGGSGQVTVEDQTITGSLTSGARAAAAGGTVMLFLLFFLLASGDLFLRKLAHVVPRFRHRRNIVEIVRQIERDFSRYLSTMAAINLGLGCAIAAVLWLLGMPNPLLWGAVAATLNFVPYIGPLVGVVITGLVALVEFETTGQAVLVPAAYLLVNGIEGYLVTPLIMGERLALNPVALLVGIMFWGWLWGIPGALLAVPLVAMMKIVADHIDVLRPLGEFLGT